MKSIFFSLFFFFAFNIYGQPISKPDSITLEQDIEVKAIKIQKALLQGADFCTMTLWYSKDATKDDCGFIKNIKLSDMLYQWSKEVGKLKEKELGLFQTNFGFHIVRVVSIKNDYYTVQQIIIN
jgi:parvulin-like peptidyl-prolyl isomerase